MQKYSEPTPEDYIAIAEKVHSGEYFRESRAMYDIMVNDSLSERYFYVFVTILALLTMAISFFAMQSLYPLSRSVPFINWTENPVDERPALYKLKQYPEEPADSAILLYYCRNFVLQYEEYDIRTIERNMNGLRGSSTPELFADYQRMMQPTNPESPVVKYQRHSSRLIKISSSKILKSPTPTVEILFEATVRSENGNQTAKFRALVGYDYSGIEIDTRTGKITPPRFVVTSYSSKPI